MTSRPSERQPDPLPAHVFQIMLSLLEGGSHGYTVIQDVAERTGGRMQLGTSTLYAVIKRLERMGWAEPDDPPAEESDGRRKYHRLTAAGRAAVRAEALRIRELEQMLRDPELERALKLAADRESGS